MKNIITGAITELKDFNLDSYKSNVFELIK